MDNQTTRNAKRERKSLYLTDLSRGQTMVSDVHPVTSKNGVSVILQTDVQNNTLHTANADLGNFVARDSIQDKIIWLL